MWHRVVWLLAGALLPAVVGCGISPTADPSLVDLQAPEQLTLFSIDGRDAEGNGIGRRGEGVSEAVGEFRGYPVLGQVEVTDPDLRNQLIAALKDGYARRPARSAKCFWPRHGVRAVEKGKTVEYVICFQCLGFEEFVGDKRRFERINPDVQPTFPPTASKNCFAQSS